MTYGKRLLVLVGVLSLVGGQAWSAGGPRPSAHTVFRAPIRAENVRSRFPSFEAMRAEVDREASIFRDVMFPLMREGGRVNIDGTQREIKPTLSTEAQRKLTELERTQRELVEAAQRLQRDPNLTEEAKLRDLQTAFEAREAALEAFRSEGAKDKIFTLTENGRFGLSEAIDFRTSTAIRSNPNQGSSGPAVGTHGRGTEQANTSNRASGETRGVGLGETFRTEWASLDATFGSNRLGLNAPDVAKALRETYPPESTGDRAERGFTVFQKAKELLERMREMESRGELKMPRDKITQLIESMIRGEAAPEQMEAVKLMVEGLGADADAAAGLGRMVGLDLFLRKAVKDGKLKPEDVGQKMMEWLQAGEDFRALITPDYSKMNELERSTMIALSNAARELWLSKGSLSWAEVRSKALERNPTLKLTADHERLVNEAGRKLAEAKEPGKGEDAALAAALCSGECKGHFAIKCAVR